MIKEHQDPKDLKELKDSKEPQVLQAQRDHPVLLERQDSLVLVGILDLKEHQVQKEILVHLAHLVQLDLQETLGHRGRLVSLVPLVLPVQRETQVQKEYRGLRETQELLVQLDF